MNTFAYSFLLACSVVLSGCCRAPQGPEPLGREKEGRRMIQIENLILTEKSLTLDYEVSNPFAHEIWICEDIDVRSKYDVETRIDAETVWIKLRFNLECNFMPWPGVLFKYRRLPPGQSHSGKILLNLPIANASPVYYFGEFGKKKKQVVLHRAVFEVGYFEGDLLNTLSERIERAKGDTTGNLGLESEAVMMERIQHCQSRNTVYLPHLWPGESMEKCAEVLITDVDIPCSIVVDEE